MSGKYARRTSVSVEQSKAEIERIVERYGASQFFSGWAESAAVIGFRMRDRFVRFSLPMPTDEEVKPAADQIGLPEALARAKRQRWRALALVLKAKLEAVESGISDFETEFLGNITVANGQTVGEWAKPQLADMYSSGRMPQLMPGGTP